MVDNKFEREIAGEIKDLPIARPKTIKKRYDVSFSRLNEKVEILTESVDYISNEFKRTKEIAEEAKKTVDSIMSHIKLLESNIGLFERNIVEIRSETNKQTNKLNDLIESSKERSEQNTETQQLIKELTSQMDGLVKSEDSRIKKELVNEALKSKEEKRIEDFWKRLPVVIGSLIFVGGILLWLFNALLTQSKVIQQQQNVLQTKESK